MAQKYRKTVVIEAQRYDGANAGNLAAWMGIRIDLLGHGFIIPTLEGDMLASPGDYIIKGVQGEFYPCKPDIFEATYEGVEL